MVEVYIGFNGNCEQAMEFYQKALNGEKPNILRYGDIASSPNHPVEESQKNLVLHGEMIIKGSVFNFCDFTESATVGDNISIALKLDSEEEVRECFNGLKSGGSIHQELTSAFFSPLFGSLVDKFGINWIIILNK